MAQREVRAFDYVNQPYEPVRDLIMKDAAKIFGTASQVAEARAGEIIASLSIDLKGVKVSKDIAIKVGAIREEPGPKLSHVTHVQLEWAAAGSPGLFPVMKADVAIYPLSPTETQIDFSGKYEPPLGLFGGAMDAAVGHRMAEASVHRFVVAVVERLRQEAAKK
jgi:hypothetical protein